MHNIPSPQSADDKIESEIVRKGLTAPRITKGAIDHLMSQVFYVATTREEVPDLGTSTFVHAFLGGKFYLATGHSACVSPANFDAVIGYNIAKENAELAARTKLWELEGYCLAKALNSDQTA